jgi:phospholipid-binding lipoprotein MlaA
VSTAPSTGTGTALRLALSALALAVISGCASVPAGGTTNTSGPGLTTPAAAAVASTPGDPWENWNRKVYAFNDAIDTAVLKPVAETYQKVVPSLVRTGISNVLGNIRDVWSTANQFLQGKLQYGLEMGMRVLTNSVFGIGGLLDPATEMGLVRRQEDFGQTLGRWGVGPGPYVVLPLLGPSTVRDTAGFVVDRQVSPASLAPTAGGSYSITAIELVDTRTRLLSAGKLLDQVALDRYSFLRDAYLASRLDAIYDGAPPMESFNDDPGDDPAKPASAAKPTAKSPTPATAPAAAAAAAPAASAASSASK